MRSNILHKYGLHIMVLIVLSSLVSSISSCGGGGGGSGSGPNPTPPPTYDVASWSFVDGNTAVGINKIVTNDIRVPQITLFGSKLYAAWEEWTPLSQIRVAVYNGNDGAPSWSFVDNALNFAAPSYSPQLTVFSNKLYASWQVCGTSCQIHTAVYNGNDSAPNWTIVDGSANGINKEPAKDAGYAQLTVFGSQLYTTWSETNGTAYQIRAAVYNGNDTAPVWTFVDGGGTNGLNKYASNNAGGAQLAVFCSKLYATWMEWNPVSQVRVAVYSGPSWSFVDGGGANGINKDGAQYASNPQLTVFGSKLYSTWTESQQVRVAVYNGNDSFPSWSFVDGGGTNGINKDVTQITFNSQLTVFGTKLYATWQESNGSADQIRTAVYNGNDSAPVWAFKDGGGTNGLNKDTTRSALTPQLTAFGMKLYAIWRESNGTGADQVRVTVGTQ